MSANETGVVLSVELQQSVFARVAVDYAEVELVQEAKYYPPKTDPPAVVEFHPTSVAVNSFPHIVPESQAHLSSSYPPPEEPPKRRHQ